jgi:hypothetical protein
MDEEGVSGNHKGRIYPRIWMKKAHLITQMEGPAQEEGRTGGSFPEVNDVLDPFPQLHPLDFFT